MTEHLPTPPAWLPPLDTGQPSTEDLNNLGALPKANFAAANSVIPLTYGRDRLFGQVCVVHVDETLGFLYLAYSFCEGEIAGYETVFIDGTDVNDPTTGFLLSAGSVVELHVGTAAQTTSTLLSGIIAGYTDTLPNTAYVVLKVPQGSTQGFPRLEAIIQGRKVYDPRLDSTQTGIVPVGSGAHRVGDPTTWAFTQNPTICFRDMITNFTGWTLLEQGVVDNADENDTLVTGVPRRAFGLSIAKSSSVASWVKGFRTYMGAFLGWESGKVRIVPNRPDVEFSGALSTDGGALSAATVGNVTELDFGAAQDFSVELSFKPTVSGGGATQMLFGKKIIPTGLFAGWAIYMNASDQIAVSVSDGTNGFIDTDTTTNVMDGAWHTIAFTVDQTANDLIVTVDDVARAPVDISAMTLTLASASTVRIGANSGNGDLYDGLIDEVRVWDDVRTPAELTANRLAEITTPVSAPNLVGYWKMNEESSATTVNDESVSANPATLAGAAVFAFGNPQIIPDGVAMHIGVDDIVKESLKLKRRSLRQTPNSVAVDYEDSSGVKWFTSRVQVDSPRVTSGDEARRLSTVSLPGIHNASQAQREATERLNWYLTDLECTLTLFDEGWQLQHGSIVAVTHPIGLDAKLFRVRQSAARSGRWILDLVEYDPAVYSDSVIADPTIPDTNLGDPLNPPTVTGLTLAEELFNYKTGTTGSRVRVSWDATGFPFLSQYLVEGWVGGVKVWQTFTGANDIVTPPVEEIVDTIGTPTDYEVRVYVQSPFAQGAAAIQTLQIDGKFAIPSDAGSVTVTQTAAGSVSMSWIAATDIDIWRYEVRRGATTDSWATATDLGADGAVLVDGLTFAESGVPLGTYRYFVKAIDSVQQPSTNASVADVTLSAPSAVSSVGGFEVASEVRLNWTAVTTGFVERYRIAYSDIPQTFETTLDIVDTLRFQTKDVPEGTFTFKVYSLDALGNEATSAATIVIEVTSDADAFLADTYDFITPALNNMVEYDVRLDNKAYYVTNQGQVFAVTPTDFVDSVPLANYHNATASEWLSETKDFGLPLTGSWNLTHDVVALSGTFTLALELSTDNITFASFGTSSRGQFQYARVRISTFNPPGTDTSFVKSPLMNLKINVVPLEESGESVSSPTSGVGKTLNLTREYTALKEIVVQPKNTILTGSAVTAIVDNIVIGSNTGIANGATQRLDGGDITAFEFGSTQDYTVEFMMKHTGNTLGGVVRVMGKRTGSGAGWAIQHAETTENVSMTIDDGTNEVTASLVDACPNDGAWHHIAFTVDRTGDQVRGYVDKVEDTGSGSPFSISTVTGALGSGATVFRMFADESGTAIWENGLLDEVRVWDDVRSGVEITNNADVELDMTVTQANLIAYWRMNGTTGEAVTTGAGDVPDATVNGYDLTASAAGMTYVDAGDTSLIQKINSFDVYIFDTFGQQLAEQFQWKWKAV